MEDRQVNAQIHEAALWSVISRLLRRFPHLELGESRDLDQWTGAVTLTNSDGEFPLVRYELSRQGEEVVELRNGEILRWPTFGYLLKHEGARGDLNHISQHMGVAAGGVAELPPTTPRTLVARYLAAVFAQSAFSDRCMTAHCGLFLHSTEGTEHVHEAWLRNLGMDVGDARHIWCLVDSRPGYLPDEMPICAFDVRTAEMRTKAESFDMMAMYRRRRSNLWSVVLETAPDGVLRG